MDFLLSDNENWENFKVNGNSEIVISGGRVAQVQGHGDEYSSDDTTHTTTVTLTGESEIGYFYCFDQVALQSSSKVLVGSTKFSQFDSVQKPFYSVDNLVVDSDAYLTTQNCGQARIISAVFLKGTWDQRYSGGNPLTDDAQRYYADLRIGNYIEIDGGTLISCGSTHVYNDLEAVGGTLVFMQPAIVGMTGNDYRVFSVDRTDIYLPIITSNSFYPAGNNLIRLAIGEKATGTADVYLFEGDDYTNIPKLTDWHVGQNYINAQREISDAVFTLMTDDIYYFKRVDDTKTFAGTAYDMWQIAKPEAYKVIYEYEGEVPSGADAVLPEAESKLYRSSVEVAANPELAGYEFSGWRVKSPDSVMIENGKFTMPEENVTLVGSWTKKADPVVNIGALSVSKTVSGSWGSTTKEFTFTVTLGDSSINGKYGDMTFNDGVAVFTLKHGESKTASALPAGVRYSVTESDNIGYTVTAVGNVGTIQAGKTASAAFLNYRGSFFGDGSSGPHTGDTANLALWLTLMTISGAGLTGALVFGKKKQYHSKHSR